MPTPLEEIDKALGLTSAPVPLPRPQQEAVQAAELPRAPRPRPAGPEAPAAADVPPLPFDAIDAEFAALGQPGAEPTNPALESIDAELSTLPDRGWVGELGAGIARGFNIAQTAGPAFRMATGITDPVVAAAQISEQLRQAETYAAGQDAVIGAMEFEKTDSVLGALGALLKHPAFAASVFGESLGSSALSAGLGAVGSTGGTAGAALGVGVGSGLTEYASSLVGFLNDKKGVDVSDPEQLASAVQNPEWMEEAKAWALKRGVAVGTFDALTAGVAGKAAALAGRGLVRANRPIASRVAAGGTGVGIEAAGGGGGETTAQLLTEGSIDMHDVVLETVGEVAGGAPEVALTARTAFREARDRSRGRAATAEDIAATGAEREALPPRVVSPEEAEAEGRTLFGFESDETPGEVEVGEYTTAEVAAARRGVRRGRLIAVRPENTRDRLDYNSLTEENIRNIRVDTTPEDGNRFYALARQFVQTVDPTEKAAARVELDRFFESLPKGTVVIGGRNPARFVRSFRGDTRDLGTTFRQIDYAGVQIDRPPVFDPSVPEATHYARPTESTAFDIDLRKVKPTSIRMTTAGLNQAARTLGQQEVAEMARKSGSTEEAVETLESFLRVGGGSLGVNQALRDGTLRLPLDARLTRYGIDIVNTAEAIEDVTRALVRRPTGKTRSPIDTVQYSARLMPRTVGRSGVVSMDMDVSVPFASLSKDEAAQLTAAAAVMQEVIKRFNIPYDVSLQVMNSAPFGLMGASGWFTLDPLHYRAIVAIQLPKVRDVALMLGDPQYLYSVLTHEFGHYLAATGFVQQSAERRTEIYAAYRRFLESTKAAPNVDHIRRAMSSNVYRTGTYNDPVDSDYQYSFDEWWAEQVARWSRTGRRPVGIIAKVAKSVARRFIEAMKLFEKNDPTNLMRAEPEVEKWLNSMLDGRVRVEWAGAVQAAHNAETRKRNERAMEGQDIGEATPMTPQSTTMRFALSQLGLETLEREGAARAVQSNVTLPPLGRVFGHVDRFNWFYKWMLSLPQVAERNQHLLPLQKYRELVQLAHLEQSKIMGVAQERLQEWRNLGRVQAEALGQMLFELTQMDHQPTQQELTALVAKYKVSGEGVQLYGKIRQDFTTALDRYVTELVNAANTIADPTARSARLSEIRKMRAALTKRPYFPMTRYGKWTLTVRENQRLEHFETFETKAQLRRAARAAQKRWPAGSGYEVQQGVLAEEARGLIGVPPQMLDLMSRTLKLNQAQRDALEQLKFDLAPAQSFKKRFLHRSEVSGWSEDAQRNYAHYMFHHAKHYMRVKYEGPLRLEVRATRAERKLRGPDATKVGQIANFLNHHLEEFLNPKADLSALRSIAAVWYLGFVPQSALLNLTQLGFATGPFLAAKFGDGAALGAIRKAVFDVRTMYTKGALRNITTAEFRALNEAIEEGLIDESQAAELAALSEGNALFANLPGAEVKRRWSSLSNMAMGMFQATEQYNRRVTFRAAWRLAMDDPGSKWVTELSTKHGLQMQRLMSRGWSQRDALAFLAGKDAVMSTQFEYAKYARPRFMQGRKGALFMFFLFTQNMLFLLGNNKGVLPRYLLGMMLIGGLMGIPGMEDAEEIIKAMAGKFGKDFSVEREARKLVVDVLGADDFAADVMMRGISRTSLGVPQLMDQAGITVFPAIDMSRAIGMGQVFPVNPAFIIGTPGASTERAFSDGVTNAAGAAFGIGLNLHKAVTDTMSPWNDWKRWERAMPRSAKNATRSMRYLIEGRERDAKGATVAAFDSGDPEQMAEIAAVAMGFTPTRLSQEWDRRAAEYEVFTFWMARKTILTGRLTRAIQQKDDESRRETLESIKAFNRELPYESMRFSPESLRQSVRRRIQNVEREEAGAPLTRSRASVSQEMRRLYPDAVSVTPTKKILDGAGSFD